MQLQSSKIPFTCPACRETTLRWPSDVRGRNHCSMACRSAHHFRGVCGWCKRDFDKIGTAKRLFCSRACLSAARTAAKQSLATRLWSRVNQTHGCWIWTGSCDRHGYGQITGRGMGSVKVHRLSWELAHGEIPEGLRVCHRCDNPPCVRPDHLFLGTAKDNSADMTRKGRGTQGERNAMAKLTEGAVIEIRTALAAGASMYGLAKRFGVTASAVARIRDGETWKHVH